MRDPGLFAIGVGVTVLVLVAVAIVALGVVSRRREERLMDELMFEALLERDGAKAQAVIQNDRVIDTMEMEVEETCINLLALQQPMARDLRMLTSALKIANDLERVGDHAVNIAQSAARLARCSASCSPT